MNEFSFSNVLDQAWEHTKKHGLLIAVIFFVISIVSYGIQSLLIPQDAMNAYVAAAQSGNMNPEMMTQFMSSTWQSSVLSNLVSIALSIGLYAMVLGIVKGTMQKPDFDAYKMPIITYVKYIGVEIISGLIILAGIVCCVLPGIFLAIRLQFAATCILDDPDCDILEAFKRSWNMTSGHFMTLLGIVLACIVIAIVGMFCCCIGFFFAYAYMLFISMVAFCMLKDNGTVKNI